MFDGFSRMVVYLPTEYLQLKDMDVINIIFLTIGLMFKSFFGI